MQYAGTARHLAGEGKSETLRNILAGEGPFAFAGSFRKVRQVRQGVGVGNGFRESVAAGKADALLEAFLDLQGSAVIDGESATVDHKEVSQLAKLSPAKNRLTRRQGCGLHSIEHGGIGPDLQTMHIKVAGRNNHA